MSEQIENVGSNGDTKIVSELMGYIRDVIDRQVSDKARTKSGV